MSMTVSTLISNAALALTFLASKSGVDQFPSRAPILGTTVQPSAARCAVARSLARPVIQIAPPRPAPDTSPSSGGDQ